MLRLLHHLGANLPLAGLIFLLEGIGLPIPVEIPLGIMGYRLAHETLHLVPAILLMWLTTTVGNVLGYWIGYRLGRAPMLRILRLFRIKQQTWDRLEGWFTAHGLKTIIFTRWINWGFAQSMWLSGITRIPFRRFFPTILLNNLLWAIGWTWLADILISFFRRRGWQILHGLIDHLPWVLLGAGALGVLAWWIRRRVRSAKATPTPK